MERKRCGGNAGACGALEGELHQLGCDYERCTKCGGQFLYCDCPEDYADRKRVPFFRLHWLCCQRCGAPWPKFFNVPDDVWQHYILSLGDGNPLLCVDCFNFIAELTDGGEYARKHGGPIMNGDPAYSERVRLRRAGGATAWCFARLRVGLFTQHFLARAPRVTRRSGLFTIALNKPGIIVPGGSDLAVYGLPVGSDFRDYRLCFSLWPQTAGFGDFAPRPPI
jgi:hypothetical protein